MRSSLTTTSIRVVLAVLAGLGDLGIQQLSHSRIEPSQLVLFLLLSVLAGVIIGQWWATLIAVTCVLLAASISPGGEDAGGAVEALFGAELAIAQAVLIGLGVAAAKMFRSVWRRQHASCT